MAHPATILLVQTLVYQMKFDSVQAPSEIQGHTLVIYDGSVALL